VNWPGSVVIFDEAHNLEGIASDAACELKRQHVVDSFLVAWMSQGERKKSRKVKA
jgi:Rad3-related DNA helicase